MDMLSNILNAVRLESTVYFQHDFSAPWGMEMPSTNFAQFHLIVKGKCYLHIEGQKELLLQQGDKLLLLQGQAHQLLDNPKSKSIAGREVLTAYEKGSPLFQGEASTTLICGHFVFDKSSQHLFFKDLPPLIHLTKTQCQTNEVFERITTLLIKETNSKFLGRNALVDRFAEALLIHMLRTYMVIENPSKGYLAALSDRKINKALEAIHEKPETDWTLMKLAGQIGMSRAAFAKRFKELLDIPPMQYITEQRMQKARALLRSTDLSLSNISEQVGYLSEAAFNRAFKRHFRQNPGAMRRKLKLEKE